MQNRKRKEKKRISERNRELPFNFSTSPMKLIAKYDRNTAWNDTSCVMLASLYIELFTTPLTSFHTNLLSEICNAAYLNILILRYIAVHGRYIREKIYAI